MIIRRLTRLTKRWDEFLLLLIVLFCAYVGVALVLHGMGLIG